MKTIAITSGKGGVGKTNVATNLAISLGKSKHRTALLDADLGLANADLVLGVAPTATLADVLFQGTPLKEALVPINDYVSLIPAASGIRELERLTPDKRSLLLRALDELEDEFDYLLIDTGAGIGDNVMFFCDFADAVLLVTIPEPTAITDAYAMIKLLSKNYGRNELSIVVNQAPSASAAATVHSKLGDVANRFLGIQLDMAGYLPVDHALPKAVAAQKSIVEADPRSPFSRATLTLAQKLHQRLLHHTATRRRELEGQHFASTK